MTKSHLQLAATVDLFKNLEVAVTLTDPVTLQLTMYTTKYDYEVTSKVLRLANDARDFVNKVYNYINAYMK